jgi:hypothetical protein
MPKPSKSPKSQRISASSGNLSTQQLLPSSKPSSFLNKIWKALIPKKTPKASESNAPQMLPGFEGLEGVFEEAQGRRATKLAGAAAESSMMKLAKKRSSEEMLPEAESPTKRRSTVEDLESEYVELLERLQGRTTLNKQRDRHEEEEIIQLLKRTPTLINQKTKQGSALIHIIAELKDIAWFSQLKEIPGVNFSLRHGKDQRYPTALFIAAKKGSVEIVQWLAEESKVCLEKELNDQGNTVLHMLASLNNYDNIIGVIDYLATKHANLFSQINGINAMTPYEVARNTLENLKNQMEEYQSTLERCSGLRSATLYPTLFSRTSSLALDLAPPSSAWPSPLEQFKQTLKQCSGCYQQMRGIIQEIGRLSSEDKQGAAAAVRP